MATRKYNVFELGKQATVKQSHTLREQCEEMNIGLMSFGTYVARSFDGRILAESMALDAGKVSWGSGEHAIIVTGAQGMLVRFAQVSTCKKYAQRNGKVIALGSFGDGLSLVDGGTVAEFVRDVSKGDYFAHAHGYKVAHDGATFFGMGVGAQTDWRAKQGEYATLIVMTSKGKLVALDMESKRNVYNAKVVGAGMGSDEDKAKGAQAVREFAKAGGAVKARNVENATVQRVKKAAKKK